MRSRVREGRRGVEWTGLELRFQVIPTASDVLKQRSLAAMLVRLGALGLALYPAYGFLILSVYWVLADSPGFPIRDPSAFGVWAIQYSVVLLVAVGLFAFARRLARIVVRLPAETQCPKCLYALTALAELRCPECGLVLDDAFRPLLRSGTPSHTAADSPKPE